MKNHASKLCFAEAFISLVELMSVDKITVNMIVETIGKHRKTFYYHFSDKRQLIVWIFRYDLAQGLLDAFPQDVLVYEESSQNNLFAEFPYYVLNIKGTARIYNAPFFELFARSLEKRRTYYREVFSQVGLGTLEDYLYQLYQPRLKEDIYFLINSGLICDNSMQSALLKEHLIHGSAVDFLAEFYTGAFISRFIRRLNWAQSKRTVEEVMPYENVIHDSIFLLLHEKACLDDLYNTPDDRCS